ncbi:MAG TPA: thiamine pyrophosphate-dependent enzyme [bacterium]|nr:MAG: 2-oxoglutarate oxidoreductase subunit KorB [bacterium ADurb.Bin236]HOY63045.1 thiamine pyrophosphate-dependent enzyme [bacterium]HPI75555.1 thiamine pyrophosphate-dependent enzyme [bacterium]HPN94908.1 thiamine pyrophosphate-dependent enzyme [bacterium]
MSGTAKLKETAWCPGCGNFNILKSLDAAIDTAGLDRKRLVMVSGIGQAAKCPHYTDANVFNGLHGRALPAATGIKIANRSLTVIVASGDGDMYGEGGNHLLNAMRRNIGVKAFVHNNQVYGLTKGQASPTSEPGFVTKIQTKGVVLEPLNPLALGVAENCSFVARSSSVMPEHLTAMMAEAIKADGFALLDILQPCVSFNKINTAKWYKERCKELPADYDPSDREAAFAAALKWGDEIPVGIIYRGTRRSFEDMTTALAGEPLRAFSG